ncbi:Histidine kinase [Desulfosarcina cetonica]|uniref:sensor histidine kinase n=1 Tax=Desulfosarcina cetonica TaxID=90730 RepID=UPI0006D1623F|nr:ATP-binding protein [Desulfosarcina cetonica]VTR66206.1 Histidine kinase [Desulfosarcina cetonica]
MKLNTKLSLIFLLLTVVPALVIGYLSFYNGRCTIEENTISHLVSTNLLKEAEYERWVHDSAQLIEMIAISPFFKNTFPAIQAAHDPTDLSHEIAHQRIKEHLNPVLEKGTFWELFILRASDGLLMVSTDRRQEGKYKDNRPFFINGKKGTFIQNVYYGMSIQKPAMTVSTPLKDLNGETIAVLAGRLDLSQLSKIMEKRSGLSETEDTYLVNKFNFYVTEPRFGKDYALRKSIHTQGVAEALQQKDGVGLYLDYRGVPVIGAYQWMPEWELCLVTEVDQAEAYAPIDRLRKTVLGIVAGISLLAASLGWASAFHVTIPLRRLLESTDKIEAGRLEVSLATKGRGEIADLARAFDRMVKRLSTTLVSRDALAAEIEERKKETALREQVMADLKRSNEELQQFAYVASHDLQEPLRMVSSYSQLLADRYKDKLDEKANKYIHYAVDGAVRMQQLIQDLLAYSRVTTKGGEIAKVESQPALQNALSNLEAAIAESGAVITQDPLPSVAADGTQLTQLFQNLVGNAIKFRGDTSPRIHVGAEKDGEYWRFSVADNGIGIEERYLEKIFVIFQRLHTRSEYAGTGIGLSICKRIVERFGGRIWLKSEPGKGSTFYFILKAG